MTPLCMSQWCQWLRCACHSGVNDSAVHVRAVSMTPLYKSRPSQIFDEFFLKLWIHEIWEVSLFIMLYFDRGHPRICYIKGGLSPGLNPWFGVLRFVLSCDSAVQVTGVSMTLLCKSQQSKWLHMHVTAVSMTPQNFYINLHICTAVSMTPLCMSQRCQWLCCARHSGVNDSAVHVTVVSLTLLVKPQWCQWHRCATNFSDFLGSTKPYWKRL
jgi:hypothetical protein